VRHRLQPSPLHLPPPDHLILAPSLPMQTCSVVPGSRWKRLECRHSLLRVLGLGMNRVQGCLPVVI
jgi:hypothetical protein